MVDWGNDGQLSVFSFLVVGAPKNNLDAKISAQLDMKHC